MLLAAKSPVRALYALTVANTGMPDRSTTLPETVPPGTTRASCVAVPQDELDHPEAADLRRRLGH